MTTRRNFDPAAPRSAYERRHIRFQCVVDVDLHNVGGDFELRDAQRLLNEALTRGLKSLDPNDEAVAHSAVLTARPECRCYEGRVDERKEESETMNSRQCRQIVRAGHRCPYTAKRDGFCDSHWLKRFGHQWETPALICARCREHWEPNIRTACLLSPYLDQPVTVYPESLKERH